MQQFFLLLVRGENIYQRSFSNNLQSVLNYLILKYYSNIRLASFSHFYIAKIIQFFVKYLLRIRLNQNAKEFPGLIPQKQLRIIQFQQNE